MDIEKITPVTILIAFGLWAAKQLWDIIKKKDERFVTSLQENTLAITKLTIKIEYLEKKIDEVGEIRRDLDKLGSKVRDMHK